jgi:excisionase family DNA binding protein
MPPALIPTDPETRPWLTVPEASSRSTLSESTIRTLIRQKRLRVYRPSPRRVLISRDELDAYIAAAREDAARV